MFRKNAKNYLKRQKISDITSKLQKKKNYVYEKGTKISKNKKIKSFQKKHYIFHKKEKMWFIKQKSFLRCQKVSQNVSKIPKNVS